MATDPLDCDAPAAEASPALLLPPTVPPLRELVSVGMAALEALVEL